MRSISSISLCVFLIGIAQNPALGLAAAAVATPEVSSFERSLEDAESKAKSFSGSLKASVAMVEASRFQARSAESALYPNLSLQGNYYYQTNVPNVALAPGFPTLNFGTHNNYSVGPVLNYTLFDAGKNRAAARSSDALADAKAEDLRTQTKLVQLLVRQAYFQVQYALKQLDLTADSLKLAQARSGDINQRLQAGAASRLDQVTAVREVLSYELKFRQAQADLSSALQGLLALTGEQKEVDTARPVTYDLLTKLPKGTEPPTVKVRLETLEATLENYGKLSFKEEGKNTPKYWPWISSQGLQNSPPKAKSQDFGQRLSCKRNLSTSTLT